MASLLFGRPITCPLGCVIKTSIPTGGVEGLKTNLQLKNLAEQHPAYTFRQNADKTLTSADASIQKCDQLISELQRREGAIQANLESNAEEIDRLAEEQIAIILRKQKMLKAQLSKSSEKQLSRIRKDIAHVQHCLNTLQTKKDTIKQMGSNPQYATIKDNQSVLDKMEEASEKVQSLSISTDQQPAKFVPEKDRQVAKLGRIVKPRNLELVEEFGSFARARSITCSSSWRDMLAVCDMDQMQVLIYKKRDGHYFEKMRLALMASNPNKPRDMAITPEDKFLVTRGIGIEVYSPGGVYEKTIKTIDANNLNTEDNVWSVTTDTEGRILAGDIDRCVITQHNMTGKILKTIKTSIKPRYLCALQGTHVAISDWESGKLSVLDCKLQREVLSIDITTVNGICYDKQTDCIFLGRSEQSYKPGSVRVATGVIEQYCVRTGRFIACLAHGLYHPHCLKLMPSGTLAVADHKTVKIYKIK